MLRSRLGLPLAVLAAVGLALAGCSGDATRDGGGEIVTGGAVDAFQLQAGDCISFAAMAASSQVANVPGLPCSDPHDAEIVGSFDITNLDQYSENDIASQADEECSALMNRYVGPGWIEMDSNLNVTYLAPSQNSWAEGDRQVTCIAVTDDGSVSLTASVKGTQ